MDSTRKCGTTRCLSPDRDKDSKNLWEEQHGYRRTNDDWKAITELGWIIFPPKALISYRRFSNFHNREDISTLQKPHHPTQVALGDLLSNLENIMGSSRKYTRLQEARKPEVESVSMKMELAYLIGTPPGFSTEALVTLDISSLVSIDSDLEYCWACWILGMSSTRLHTAPCFPRGWNYRPVLLQTPTHMYPRMTQRLGLINRRSWI